ncbi:uncharacterized protein E0L32_009569 [Thyridium curvatum]|uniref:Uncharacterized protein n=1 Tax=Thyridium curvatum TaxID=1093900 RepID=A0A507AXG9_9PEZI|nr:uncharacterized protein E0L32_009569 [Thyridium curvatum]TPX08990.1 hypothetical protein E0L32_009569 [Thyridium curvatum]
MSPFQAEEVATNPAPSSTSSPRQDEKPELEAEIELGPTEIRDIVRLIQCPRCSLPLTEPVTLPCGKSLCKQCLPVPHLRANISYPATASRLQGFECPFPECAREHALGDCTVDVTLRMAMTAMKSELDKARALALASGQKTSIEQKDQWAVAGISSLQEKEAAPRLVEGGKLVATYTLVEQGGLDYHAEVTYTELAAPDSDQLGADALVLHQVKASVRQEMDCQICYALFYDPITTPCGHTFCRHCLHRVLDHAAHCPVCRRTLSVQPLLHRESCHTNERVWKTINHFWSDAVALRKQAIAAEGHNEVSGFDIPVFVCTLSFPSMPTFLHIFEPRYRLMIRRALEGDRTFGMVLYQRPRSSSDRNFTELGTILRIVNVEFFPDGRSLLETVGVSRFRILRHGTVDGYMMANIEKINDISIAEEEELEVSETRQANGSAGGHGGPADTGSQDGAGSNLERPRSRSSLGPLTKRDLESMPTQALMDFASDYVGRMREQSVEWLTARMMAIYGECPDDPAKFPWWFASILPVKDEEKYRLLETSSVRERLKICCGWILEWEATRW